MNKNLYNKSFLIEQDLIAMNLVKQYAIDHMDKSDKDYQKNVDELQVFTCWKNKNAPELEISCQHEPTGWYVLRANIQWR